MKDYTTVAQRVIDNKRQRLIAMRECLRQVQKLLPKHEDKGTQFICHNIDKTTCNDQAKDDTRRYVFQALKGCFTFNTCIEQLNPDRYFGPEQIMTLRRQWIDMLCDRISVKLQNT